MCNEIPAIFKSIHSFVQHSLNSQVIVNIALKVAITVPKMAFSPAIGSIGTKREIIYFKENNENHRVYPSACGFSMQFIIDIVEDLAYFNKTVSCNELRQ
jgi:hypothetical protein